MLGANWTFVAEENQGGHGNEKENKEHSLWHAAPLGRVCIFLNARMIAATGMQVNECRVAEFTCCFPKGRVGCFLLETKMAEQR